MSTTTVPTATTSPTTTRRPRLVTTPLLLRFASIVACSVSFFLPLAVVPLLAGSTSPIAGGLANGALLAATVAGELASPWLMHRLGARTVLAAGLVLLGAPTFLLLASTAVPALVGVGVLRGLGFALAIVAGGAVTAALVPPERRGEGLALAGLVSAVPSLAALPLGVWVTAAAGPSAVFAVAGAGPLLALASLSGLSGAVPRTPGRTRSASASTAASSGILAGLRSPAVLRPALVFAGSAAVAGVVVTCVPGALTGSAASITPALLLLQPATAALGRWVAGRYGDRLGHRRLFAPGILLSAAGMAAMAATSSAPLVLIGGVVFGLGFGALQNATIAAMYDGADRAQYGTVSALWNAGYDGGMAIGALAVSLLASLIGAAAAFLALALALPIVLVLVRRAATA
ncbi:MFS transporter [Leifsonia sp. C5G2]|uniref:MFS transporter n=1 Tax=Leifsonia sp. C5G2 TaxID=2735269 RepID=UPI001584B8FC|nr:MFS transporter [Leifsonia sp. C5G2]NUU06272.1 MFS transporter [Leifsonia sp. C5G2]